MRHLIHFVAAALLCLGAVAAWAQDDDVVANPALLPKSILALRGGDAGKTQLQIVFDRSEDSKATAPLTVWLGADYFALIDGDRLTITDLRLRRRLIVDRAASTLVNLSLYGDVMLRRVELVRRLGIAKELTKEKEAPALPQSLARFWIESELGIAVPGDAPGQVEQRQVGAATRFRHGNQTIATVTPSGTGIPGEVARSWGAFIHHTLPIHPDIARWLAANGTVPARLDFTSEARGRTEKISLRLRNAAIVTAGYPLPVQLSLRLLPSGENDPEVALLRQILPHMVEAGGNRPADRAGQIAAFRAAIDRSFRDGRKFEAALRLTELALRWGRSAAACDPADPAAGPCRSKQEIDRLLRDDPRSVAMFEATAAQDRDPDRAIEIWRKLDRGDVSDPYVIDSFLARLLSERGERGQAARAFVAAFAGDPFIPSLYRDLGDHFARVTRLDLAWLCYDLGRALPNRRAPDALSGIDTIEQDLVRAYPEMF